MAPETVSAILDLVACHWTIDNQAEITLEANPGDLAPGKLEKLRESGINRLSIGVQSLEDTLLEVLGRRHTSQQAIEAYRSGGSPSASSAPATGSGSPD